MSEDLKIPRSHADDEVEVDEALPIVDTKRMFRKVDWILLPIMMITYGMQFMDKLALSSGSVFGVRSDLHLVGQDYSWCSSIFYFGFLLGNFAVARIIHIVPIGKLVFVTVCIWGIILALSSLSKSYGGLLTARFFLGLMESTVSPTFVFMTSMWWTQKQQPYRTNLWFAGNDIGACVSSLAAFGLGHAGGPLKPWKYIFITYGCLAFLWSFVILFFLPDSPQRAKFLTEQEKKFYREDMKTSDVEKKWDWEQAKSCLLDVNFWLVLIGMCLSVLPNSGVISYGYIILTSFGFTSIQSTLINLALSVFTWIAITSVGWLASHTKNKRCILLIGVVILSIVGGCMIYKGNSKGVKLAGYFVVDVQPAITPLLLGMVASNFRGNTRRSVVNSAMFLVYCACNIGGPQLFRAKDEASGYKPAFLSWIICYCLNAVLAVALIISWRICNKKMEALAASQPVKKDISESEDAQEETDKEEIMEFLDPSFRYQY